MTQTSNIDLVEKMRAVASMVFPENVRTRVIDPEQDPDYEETLNEIMFRSDLDIYKKMFIFSLENYDSNKHFYSNQEGQLYHTASE